jgi:hypothetical protein
MNIPLSDAKQAEVHAALASHARYHTGNYAGIVVNLTGDFVSGGLHPELAKTDEEESIPAALRAGSDRRWAHELGRRLKWLSLPCSRIPAHCRNCRNTCTAGICRTW